MADLADLLAEMRVIRGLIERMAPGAQAKPQRRLGKADEAELEVLLPKIFAAWGGSTFNTAGLWDAPIAGAREKLSAHLGAHTKANALALGRLLCRADGHAVEGLVVRRLGRDQCGVLWAIERV